MYYIWSCMCAKTLCQTDKNLAQLFTVGVATVGESYLKIMNFTEKVSHMSKN